MASMLLLFHCCPDPSSPTSTRPRRHRHRHLTTTTACPSSSLCSHLVKRRATLPPLFCVSSAALLTADPLQAPSTPVPFTYAPPPETDHETKLAAETFLANEESDIASAAADAVALAREAAEMAKNAVEIVGSIHSSRHRNPVSVPSEPDLFLMERVRHTEMEFSEKFKHFDASKNTHESEKIMQISSAEAPNFELADTEYEVLEPKYSNRIRVKSTRQNERRARRSRAAAKMSANVLCMKSTSSSRRKRASVQEVDYSDPLRYLRGTTSTSKLLTAAEELELSEGIQDLLKLEKLQEELTERYGSQPTFTQWASAAKTDQKTLRKRLNHGIFSKDKMIKSNIRLVISIAKNFQGAGMNIQDLVQEGCRGLVRGAEKFDASKGFKFSTYAHWWIKQAVRKSLSDQSRTIRLPFHMVDATYRVREARKQLYSETGRYPNNEEIAEMTGLSMKRLQAVLLTPKAPRSLEQKIGISQNLKPSEVIADPDAETAEDLLMKRFMKQDLNKVLDSLNPREKQVIRWRFGLQDGRMKTLQEIGELMGVSRERIRQIESSAFRKLKNKKKTKNLKQYLIS